MNTIGMIQINMFVGENDTRFEHFHPNIPRGLFYPVAIVRDYGTLSKANADEWRETVGVAVILQHGSFGLFLGLCGTAILISFSLLCAVAEVGRGKNWWRQQFLSAVSDESE